MKLRSFIGVTETRLWDLVDQSNCSNKHSEYWVICYIKARSRSWTNHWVEYVHNIYSWTSCWILLCFICTVIVSRGSNLGHEPHCPEYCTPLAIKPTPASKSRAPILSREQVSKHCAGYRDNSDEHKKVGSHTLNTLVLVTNLTCSIHDDKPLYRLSKKSLRTGGELQRNSPALQVQKQHWVFFFPFKINSAGQAANYGFDAEVIRWNTREEERQTD